MDERKSDRLATLVFWIFGALTILVLGFIVVQILVRGIATAFKPSFFLGKPEAIKAGGGVLPMIISTLYLVALTMVISLPLSVGAAVYLSEFAKDGLIVKFIRFSLDSLATLPSIVFGLFGMTLFCIYLRWGYCLIAGALTLSILNLPVFLRSTEEALKLVPITYREASMSLGASRWTTTRKVVIPSAMPGIITATILPIGRIMGESAAIIYTTGLFIRNIPLSPVDTAAPLAGYIWYAQSEAMVPDYKSVVDGGAALLLVMVLVVFLLARYLGKRFQNKSHAGK
ncbi:MAG: phosphate ABC transporter permease PstA [Actinomycetota bacterium]|nr:phosphate ABC transporter permease PstA [Actinomycetota bacterium]